MFLRAQLKKWNLNRNVSPSKCFNRWEFCTSNIRTLTFPINEQAFISTFLFYLIGIQYIGLMKLRFHIHSHTVFSLVHSQAYLILHTVSLISIFTFLSYTDINRLKFGKYLTIWKIRILL